MDMKDRPGTAPAEIFDWTPHYLDLLAAVGCAGDDLSVDIHYACHDPLLASPHRLAAAAGLAAALQGSLAESLGRWRGAGARRMEIPAFAALCSLNSSFFLRQNGYRIGMGSGRLAGEPLNGFYPAGERWFRFVGSRQSHRDLILGMLGCANTKEAIARAVAGRDPWELEDWCARAGVPGAVARHRHEWRAHPHGRLLAQRPVIDIVKLAEGPPMPLAPAPRPLAGVKVLDLTHVLAGPSSSRTLAAHGADVLRLSKPGEGEDPLYMVMDTGFGKRNAYADLDDPADLAHVRRLCAEADVFVQSYRHGSLARRGLSPEGLAALRSGLIQVNISCYGQGPWEARPGFDPNAATVTGVCLDEGAGGEPTLPPMTLLSDYLTGTLAAAGAMAALLRRAREGGSYEVRVSLARTAMWVQDLGLLDAGAYAHLPRQPDPAAAALQSMDSPFGRLEYLAPIPYYSGSPAGWHSPPLPLGASRAAW